MKLSTFLGLGLAAVLVSGCIVLSVYPFYTAKDLISDPGLAGRWVKKDKTNEFWQFTPAGEKMFILTTTDDSSTNCFEAHVFQIGQHQFLDLLTTNREMFLLPLHLISKFSRNETNVTVSFMDYGWLTRLLETNGAAVGHIIVPDEPGKTNGNMVYLTSTTPELQKFLLKYAADTNAFGGDSLVQLQRTAQ